MAPTYIPMMVGGRGALDVAGLGGGEVVAEAAVLYKGD